MAPSTISYLGGIHTVQSDEDRDVYQGYDGDRPLNLAVDEEIAVSAEKAAQLADDFPGCFEIDGKVAGERPKRKRSSEPSKDAGDAGDLREQLLAHKRDELNAAAKDLGIADVESLPNKPAVVDAILAAKAEAE